MSAVSTLAESPTKMVEWYCLTLLLAICQENIEEVKRVADMHFHDASVADPVFGKGACAQ